MGIKENFSSRVRRETHGTITSTLESKNDPILFLDAVIEVFQRMENNIGRALRIRNSYFDGKVIVSCSMNELEKMVNKLLERRTKLLQRMPMSVALGETARLEMAAETPPEDPLELNAVIENILSLQKNQIALVAADLEDGLLDYPCHIAPDFVENKKMETKTGKSPPIIEIDTQGGYQFTFYELQDYRPPTMPQKIPVPDSRVEELIRGRFEFARTNINATNSKEMELFLIHYLDQNPGLLTELGIKNIRNIAPREAILLCLAIVGRHLKYDYEQVTFLGSCQSWLPVIGNDMLSVPDLLKKGRGVCRNYTQAVKVVFDVLRNMQKPETSQIQNTYCDVTTSFDCDHDLTAIVGVLTGITGGENDAGIDHHEWNTFYTIVPHRKVQVAIVDSTWMDKDQEGEDEEKENTNYTDQRFLFTLQRMIFGGLLTEEQKIVYLEKWCSNTMNINSLSYVQAARVIGTFYFKAGNYQKGLEYYLQIPRINIKEMIDCYTIPFNINEIIKRWNEDTSKNTIVIEGVIYDVNTTKYITVKGEIPPCIVRVKNLETLYANSARYIPPELSHLTLLVANAAEQIPPSLKNLETLYANSARYIPPELSHLTLLAANAAEQIPPSLQNLETLYANSARHIPPLKKLGKLWTRAPFDKENFPNLKEVYNFNMQKWDVVHQKNKTT